MRLLMVVPQQFYSTRGTPLSAYHRVRELERCGLSVDIVTYALGDAPPEFKGNLYRARGPHFVEQIRPGPSFLKIWFDFLLFLALIARLLRGRYDVLYGHEEGAFLCWIAGWIFRIPYVYDMHSSLPRQITEWGFSSSAWVIRLFVWVERVSIRGAKAVVAISPAIAAAAQAVDPGASVVTIVNYFGEVEADDSVGAERVRQEFGIEPQAFLVVYTGSFVPLQALDLLIEAVPRVLESIPNARVLLVGGTDREIRDLARQAANLGVEQVVTMVPRRPEKEIPAFLGAADVVVSPRFVGINPPGKLFSYLASGKVVVATDTPVHNQLLDSSCAVLTPATRDGLAEGLVRVWATPELRQQVRCGAQAFLQRHCSAEARDAAYRSLMRLIGAQTA